MNPVQNSFREENLRRDGALDRRYEPARSNSNRPVPSTRPPLPAGAYRGATNLSKNM